MKYYRVVEYFDVPSSQRFVVESTHSGRTWTQEAYFYDLHSAEVHMEYLAKPEAVTHH